MTQEILPPANMLAVQLAGPNAGRFTPAFYGPLQRTLQSLTLKLATLERVVVAVSDADGNLIASGDLMDSMGELEAIAAITGGGGLTARTTAGTWFARSIDGPAAGLSVSNGDGLGGNPTLALANDLAALEALTGAGMAARTGADAWALRTLAGTLNRITVTNGDGASGAPTFDIAATYVGQTSITTLGTIATGTWQGTAVGAAYGGTGQSSYAVGDILYASGASALSKLAAGTSGYVLTSNGAGVAPSWQAGGGGGGGAATLVGTSTVAGSAVTDFTISGLNLDSDGSYLVDLYLTNAGGSNATISLYYNSDTTATNYDRQAMGMSNATLTGGRGNDAFAGILKASTKFSVRYHIVKQGGNVFASCIGHEGQTTGVEIRLNTHQWRTTATNVTSITWHSNVASAIGVGSTCKIWKLN